jgi:hypothetical protein
MNRIFGLSLVCLALLSCYLGGGQSSDSSLAIVDQNTSADHGVQASGLPCEVAQLLANYCVACHGATPSAGLSLVTLSDLTRPSKSDPEQSTGQLALARLKAGSMPPSGSARPSTSEAAAFEVWIKGGLQPGTCAGAPDGGVPDPFAGPHVCSSNSYYTAGEGLTMKPGNACITCHASNSEAPRFSIAGTVYPTGHEPADCKATGVSGAQVAVSDQSGTTHLFDANSVGNFTGAPSLTLPFTAEVRSGGKKRGMAAAQTNGDCNSCHTENGANGAPGRILLPK